MKTPFMTNSIGANIWIRVDCSTDEPTQLLRCGILSSQETVILPAYDRLGYTACYITQTFPIRNIRQFMHDFVPHKRCIFDRIRTVICYCSASVSITSTDICYHIQCFTILGRLSGYPTLKLLFRTNCPSSCCHSRYQACRQIYLPSMYIILPYFIIDRNKLDRNLV